MWGSLRVEARTLITAIETGIDGERVADMHRPILRALQARDPAAASAAIREHLLEFAKLLKGDGQ